MTAAQSIIPPYAELRCVSNFSFLKGASWPEELVERAKSLRYAALAITDECSLAGVVRAHVAAKEHKLKLLIGSQFFVQCATPFTLVVLACNADGYANLCQFITRLRRASAKGTYRLLLEDIDPADLADCVVLASPDRTSTREQLLVLSRWLLTNFIGRCWLAVELHRHIDDEMWLHKLRQASELTAIPLVASGDAHMHVRSRKPLQDVLTAVRVGRPLTECGLDLQPNAERHLRTKLRLSQRYPAELMAETLRVSERCHFSLDELAYQYPAEVVPANKTPSAYLRQLTYEGAGRRWPGGMPAKVQAQIEHELELIAEMKYEHYFLTVADIVQFARSQHILCQGRGSAANSVVCYCIGVTEVDPARMSVLFERFISKERGEPPDIDIDFEHQRREEVIQYLYNKYGRERAALTAVVISYRPRSAIRDVGKALGFDADIIDAMAKNMMWWDRSMAAVRLAEAGLDINTLAAQQLLQLTEQLLGFPRHLSQHPGGFVLTKGPLSHMVPIENAAMEDRTIIQWDKDDIDALGLLKVDVLALGMLSAIRRCLELVGERKGHVFEMQDIPAEDPKTYDMICKADTVGVFQIESRAQMSMLPRHRPRTFYDLVIQVAIVRPGPIQGGSVHPYLERRQGKTPVSYPSEALKEALGRTMGVPIFQEQVMQIAIIAAGFTPGEADGLRRAMAAWKRKGGLHKYYDRLVKGMIERGYTDEFAEGIYKQIHGFSEYGFPESHAASFALLVYASCWLKCHHPAEFLTAMLNSQPLGFYSPSQLVQDARRHDIEVRPPDVLYSSWDSTLEGVSEPPAVRLGLRLVCGLKEASVVRIIQARSSMPFDCAEDLARRADLDRGDMRLLAGADALLSLSGHRRQQVWEASALARPPQLLKDAAVDEDFLELPAAMEGEEVVHDYSTIGLTLRSHPMALLRPQLAQRKLLSARDLEDAPSGRIVRYAGIVTIRQQPDTANGTIFISLEDETGVVQAIVWRRLRERQRKEVLHARLMAVYGTWQREGDVKNLIAGHLEDLTHLLGDLETSSRDFH
ncbi:error-prone DNA polymerase [Aquabacterium soli]|uniref:Error-prone DNA polymerase n=1 Tax=Aquabacterium soli TaxID=2493092 RepID=A0A3R8S4F1_9BURK|nr:error-prone DNA polymerase [Aquabacterium soli]RRS01089.1 error-prone DNA polymerase [Aquabacterium soli]